MKPLVAIVGRPNVGKSTLFNRLVRRRRAIVEDIPGATRDRHYGDAEWGDYVFTVVDTGGFVPGDEDVLLKQVRQQAQVAVEECAVTLFVVDGREGTTSTDEALAQLLRRSGKPVILVANKMDSSGVEAKSPLADFYRLGLGDVAPVSAEHGRAVEDLVGKIVDFLPAPERTSDGEEPDEEDDGRIRLAIIGRPNVGKSTLVNALLGQERMVVSEVAGTTRDPIDSELEFEGRRYVLTDTAGIRRKKTIAQRVEQFAVIAALKAVERSDVAVLLMDATEPAVDQDAKLAGLVEERGRALLVVVNKWDKVPKDERKQEALREELKYRLNFVSYAPMLFTSALNGKKVDKVLQVAAQLHAQWTARAPTPQLNRLLESINDTHPPPFERGRPVRLYYISQVGTRPPMFALTANRPEAVPEQYKRFIMNRLRDTLDLRVPMRLMLRERPGKAKRAARKRQTR